MESGFTPTYVSHSGRGLQNLATAKAPAGMRKSLAKSSLTHSPGCFDGLSLTRIQQNYTESERQLSLTTMRTVTRQSLLQAAITV
jgi:hypothetical protein